MFTLLRAAIDWPEIENSPEIILPSWQILYNSLWNMFTISEKCEFLVFIDLFLSIYLKSVVLVPDISVTLEIVCVQGAAKAEAARWRRLCKDRHWSQWFEKSFWFDDELFRFYGSIL